MADTIKSLKEDIEMEAPEKPGILDDIFNDTIVNIAGKISLNADDVLKILDAYPPILRIYENYSDKTIEKMSKIWRDKKLIIDFVNNGKEQNPEFITILDKWAQSNNETT